MLSYVQSTIIPFALHLKYTTHNEINRRVGCPICWFLLLVSSPVASIACRILLLNGQKSLFYRFFTLGRGLHSSPVTGCSMILIGYCGLLPW